MKFMEKYIKLKNLVKHWGLKNIKTKNNLAGWQKISAEFQWTDDDPGIQLNNYTDCLLKRLMH